MSEFRALRVCEDEQGAFHLHIEQQELASLPAGDVLIRVRYSSLNYKDALSASGNRGVTRRYPHTPGIDVGGVVEHSLAPEFVPGDEVIVTGYDLGMNTAGGFAQYVRVPAAWVIKRPRGLSLREAMALGTAGLTAALCVDKLEQAGLSKAAGPLLVTGATGGVGSVAVLLLASLGYEVVACSGKDDAHAWLKALGAQAVIPRQQLQAGTEKSLLREQWSGAVDTVGGEMLFNLVKSLRYGASVACCGLTAGTHFQASVLPFILRGVNLLGVDSVELPLVVKASMWDRLSLQWKLDLSPLLDEIALEQLPAAIARMLAGQVRGRLLVRID